MFLYATYDFWPGWSADCSPNQLHISAATPLSGGAKLHSQEPQEQGSVRLVQLGIPRIAIAFPGSFMYFLQDL